MLCPDAGRVNTATIETVVPRGTHRQEEPSLDSGQLEKSILCIKRKCSSILCVDDHVCGSHFPAVLKSSIERIHQ